MVPYNITATGIFHLKERLCRTATTRFHSSCVHVSRYFHWVSLHLQLAAFDTSLDPTFSPFEAPRRVLGRVATPNSSLQQHVLVVSARYDNLEFVPPAIPLTLLPVPNSKEEISLR